jgi:hypothetical protein
MELSVSLDNGRAAFVDSIDAFRRAVETFSEHELLAPPDATDGAGWTS